MPNKYGTSRNVPNTRAKAPVVADRVADKPQSLTLTPQQKANGARAGMGTGRDSFTVTPPPVPGGTNPFGVGGGGGGGIGAAAPTPMSDVDWIGAGGDAAYQAQLAALNAALEQQLGDLTHQQSVYETDYGSALKSLGWSPEMADDPLTADVNEGRPGAWNLTDRTTAAGRGKTNLDNDFASRGLLQSSLYGSAQDDLMRSLNDQVSGVNKGRQSFLDDILRQRTSAKSQKDTASKQAEADALLRRAAGITL